MTGRFDPMAFQSAPCTRVQGDRLWMIIAAPRMHVSIRSLHQSTGRSIVDDYSRAAYARFNPLPAPEYREMRDLLHLRPGHLMFQSAPCTRVQGDPTLSVSSASFSLCFNPAPCTRVQGDFSVAMVMVILAAFQSAPCTRVQGDQHTRPAVSRTNLFQSAPCTRVQGDDHIALSYCAYYMFQSAPCTRVQGDGIFTDSINTETRVSIRSLHQSTGRCSGYLSTGAASPVSIRSLHQSTGRYCRQFPARFPSVVSIRSLHQSTGRLSSHRHWS